MPAVFCLIDLDGFKPVNDTLGRLSGDVVLTEVARRLEWVGKRNDLLGHLGGDELFWSFMS
ncbi:diguanylate cyclase domain-containing protein [Algirhabdus cladophorae]|uniref:diguanylate cyclase domain-containing protein n=1 Tax=Algirhabdus cladophorae TaxID=3377108 RepID=UPI003B846898